MKIRPLSHQAFNLASILMIGLIVSAGSAAESLEFRVVYATVPGIEKILSGRINDAIDLLESRQRSTDIDILPDELATLCALHVVKGRLGDASATCYAAVESDKSNAAYNNRGVLLAHLGKIESAIKDFDRARVRPEDMHAYLKKLGAGTAGNAELVASSNFEIATDIVKKRVEMDLNRLSVITGVRVEDLDI